MSTHLLLLKNKEEFPCKQEVQLSTDSLQSLQLEEQALQMDILDSIKEIYPNGQVAMQLLFTVNKVKLSIQEVHYNSLRQVLHGVVHRAH